jgi:hypothetical protein
MEHKKDGKAAMDSEETHRTQDEAEAAKHHVPVYARPAEPAMLRARGMHQGEMYVGQLEDHRSGGESSMTDKMMEGNDGKDGVIPSLDFRIKRGEQGSK